MRLSYFPVYKPLKISPYLYGEYKKTPKFCLKHLIPCRKQVCEWVQSYHRTCSSKRARSLMLHHWACVNPMSHGPQHSEVTADDWKCASALPANKYRLWYWKHSSVISELVVTSLEMMIVPKINNRRLSWVRQMLFRKHKVTEPE